MFGFGFGAARQRMVAGTPAPPAPMSAVAADGWRATVASPTDLSLTPATISRQGFDATGAAVAIADTVRLTKRVRQVFPNQATLSADQVALSDYVYAGDVITGAANNSTEVSPKPVAEWIMPDRRVVGNALDWEIAAFHRDARLGRTVACVQVRATDGTTTTAWQTVSAMSVMARAGDRVPVVGYKGTLDISALADGAVISVQRRVFPHFGQAASVLGEGEVNNARQAANRFFIKNVARAANPLLVYIAKVADAPNGVGTPIATGTGYPAGGYTTLAAAKAAPYDTIGNAMTAVDAALGTAGMDGVRFIFGNDGGTPHLLAGPAAARNIKCGAIILTRDPGLTRAQCRVMWGTGAGGFRPRLAITPSTGAATMTTTALSFTDIAIVRSGTASTIIGEAGVLLEFDIENADFDNGGLTSDYRGTNTARVDLIGAAITNLAHPTPFGASAGTGHRTMRGIDCTVGVAGVVFERWQMVGCRLNGVEKLSYAASRADDSGLIVACNRFENVKLGAAGFLTVAGDAGCTGVALVNLLIEGTGTASQNNLSIAADNQVGSTSHVILHHVSSVGFDDIARHNLFYDESAGTNRRTHKLMSVKGNIICRTANKGDVFVGGTQGLPAEAPFRTGHFAYTHGVGVGGNFFQWGGNDTFRVAYPGVASLLPANELSSFTAQFTAVAHTTAGPTAGAGGGNYVLQAGSPARGIVEPVLVGFDLAGAARAANGAAGGYG